MAALNRPGKTAPRLVHDLLSYDPANPPPSCFNILTDILPVYQDTDSPSELLSPQACTHRYILKPNQTRPLPGNGSLVTADRCRVSAVCVNCRQHVELVITYHDRRRPEWGHIHHLVFSPKLTAENQPENAFSWKGQRLETYYMQCSYPSCSAVVCADFLSPVFSQRFVDLLTDEALLRQRLEEALKADPERLEGLSPPLPINVISNLRTYIENALHDEQKSKTITSANKRFMTCFGVNGRPCKELLEFLGFTPQDNETSWLPPRPNTSATIPYLQPQNVFLDNASSELAVLMSQRPQYERETHAMDLVLEPAKNEFLNLLGVADYDKFYQFPVNQPLPGRLPYYEALGAVDDMSNQLIIEAYNRQIATDPSRAPYYLRCLQTIGLWRGDPGGISIAQAVSIEYANGRYTDNDVPEAYRYFQLDYRDKSLTEDAILGSFFARVGDSADDMEPRRQLWRIGDHLKNEKIKAVAEERVSTAEQALLYLGAEMETPDDFIISMYAAKVSDTPVSKGMARRAVSLIAEARNSKALKHFLETGEMSATEMDVGEAFQLLQIPDRTVDDSAILAAFSVCCSEAPGQIENYRKALEVIAKEKESEMLSNVLAENPSQSTRAMIDWPVGLNNIGNTCYLNSLLQFYFTISPFRNMVLDFENYKMQLDEDIIRSRRVGSREISLSEVKRAQRFIREMRSLFQSMITSPNSAVTPSQDLARLTLLSSTGEAEIRRKSLANVARSGLGEINGLPVHGPLGPPTIAEPGDNNGPASKDHPKKAPEVSDADSQDTFVSAPTPNSTDQDTPMDGTEIQSPARGKGDTEMKDVDSQQPGSGTLTPPNEMANETVDPPELPPPVPPRPGTQIDNEQLIQEEVELGAQQDVTEVINNVLFQAQCAIKPLGVDANGESVDMITDLFYGKTKSYITAARGTRSKEEVWADIKVDVATGSRDIYAAIDGAFDAQHVHVEGAEAEQYGAISKLPPVLQIQVQRVQFDQVKKTSFKSIHHLKLRETIYLDRYMDAPVTDRADDLHRRRREKWKWKEELRRLQTRKAELERKESSQSLPDLLKRTRERLQRLKSIVDAQEFAHDAVKVEESFIKNLTELENMTRKEITEIERREKELDALIDNQFADLRQIPYHLYAVFMHRGSVSFGHYYIYIFDFAKRIWRKYNDSYVTEVHNTDEIFGSPDDRNPPTPYFVVYIHDRMRDRVAQPVCRNVVEETKAQISPLASPPTPPPRSSQAPTAIADVEMTEVPAVHLQSGVSSPGVSVTTTEIDPSLHHNRLKRKGISRDGSSSRSV
ncbi:hypothetical protein VTO42DRAFT_1029 [Malbranchea cinnamomea]